MQMILLYPDGRRVEAVMLAASQGRMRVVVRNQRDAVELFRMGDHWISDRGDAVELEALVDDRGNGWSDFCRQFGEQAPAETRYAAAGD
ncbi:MAG: hypothetical protein LAP87_28825 [Acidobacteriia bacterium]|nr:hypothetical protein [Terriglobia bacterium]